MKLHKTSDFVKEEKKAHDIRREEELPSGVVLVSCGKYAAIFTTENIDSAIKRWRRVIKKDTWNDYPEFHQEYRLGSKIKTMVLERCVPTALRFTAYRYKDLYVSTVDKILLNPDIVQHVDTIVPKRYTYIIEKLIDAIRSGQVSEGYLDALLNVKK